MSGSNVSVTMYTIGEFAAFARVSVRMLRHYDAIGLLVPARVDPRTGYRSYSDEQLRRLLRIVELRDLGIGLDAIGAALGPGDQELALRRALAVRRDELARSLELDSARLLRIERRLSQLEGDTRMSNAVQYRPVPAVAVYAASAIAPGSGPENVSPIVGPLIERLDAVLEAAGRPIIEPGLFWYEPVEGSEDLAVHVSYAAELEPVAGEGYEVVELSAVDTMATLLHHGDMSTLGESWWTLSQRIVEDGWRPAGPSREVYLVADGHEPGPDWVTELQVPVERP